MLNNLKNRGVRDILIICADALSGIKEAINVAFPQTEYQRYIVHQVRNTLKYVSDKDHKPLAADLKKIYNAPNAERGEEIRDSVKEKWEEKYPNAIESLNSTYRKLNRQRSVFPSEQALLKALYLAIFESTKNGACQYETGGRSMASCPSCMKDDYQNNNRITGL